MSQTYKSPSGPNWILWGRLNFAIFRLSPISAKAFLSSSRYRGNKPRFHIHLPDQMVHHFNKIEIAFFVEPHLVWLVQQGLGGLSPISGITLLPTDSGHSAYDSALVHLSNAMVVGVAHTKDYRPVRQSLRRGLGFELRSLPLRHRKSPPHPCPSTVEMELPQSCPARIAPRAKPFSAL